jgi:hypothetical protein
MDFPRIRAKVTEVFDQFTVTAWLYQSSAADGTFLLASHSVDSVDESLGLIDDVACENGVAAKQVDIDVELSSLLRRSERGQSHSLVGRRFRSKKSEIPPVSKGEPRP